MSDIWEEYIKSVTKLKPSNKFVPPIDKIRFKSKDINITYTINRSLVNNSLVNNSSVNNSLKEFDRKSKRKFKSEAKLDLHGINLQNLDDILMNFCIKAIMYDFTYATIITGKGKGILKEHVINWLQHNTNYVTEYFEIKDSKNSCGSLGIHFKRLNKSRLNKPILNKLKLNKPKLNNL